MEEQRTYGWFKVRETLRDVLRRKGVSPRCAVHEGPQGTPSTSGGETEKEGGRGRKAPSLA